ncbi:STAS domain-containing protein [Streptomyces sp. NBC_00212]|uniref:STAS domain-containing protein n=1 Tax=Streptomyces sp. NBC_00212 TaxID=2975684 RepID=UPI00324CCB70
MPHRPPGHITQKRRGRSLLLGFRRSGSVAYLAVHLHGNIDAVSAEEVGRLLDEALRGGPEALDVDLSEVEHISTDGIVPLFSALKKARLSGTHMMVVGASPHVWAALHRVGFDRALGRPQGGGS